MIVEEPTFIMKIDAGSYIVTYVDVNFAVEFQFFLFFQL